ncbi:MAG: GYD domain-containing protein [Candidatus Scalindua sp.]|nr:GYD domain-containing protein [Candidatus Scalindua sp.]
MKYGRVGMFVTIVLFVATTFFSFNIYAKVAEKGSVWDIGAAEKKTLYVAHWTHTPENCPGRSADGAKMLSKFWEERKKAEEKGITILGAYVTVTEHDYFFIFEASDYGAAVEFFLPLVPSQTGKIVPVLTIDEWLKIMPK